MGLNLTFGNHKLVNFLMSEVNFKNMIKWKPLKFNRLCSAMLCDPSKPPKSYLLFTAIPIKRKNLADSLEA